jgi:hypothetical protein
VAGKKRVSQSKSLGPRLTALEEGLRDAILQSDRGKRAFGNLLACGYEADRLIIHLTLWGRSPDVLFSSSARSDLPTRDKTRSLERLPFKLRKMADELAGMNFCQEMLDPKFLQRNQMVQENGGAEMARCVELLPQTLRLYSRLLTRTLLIKNRYASLDRTLNEHRAEFTRIFFDSVKETTGKDRIDSVLILFNLVSQHFGLGDHFEKRALTARLKRLRQKAQVSPKS